MFNGLKFNRLNLKMPVNRLIACPFGFTGKTFYVNTVLKNKSGCRGFYRRDNRNVICFYLSTGFSFVFLVITTFAGVFFLWFFTVSGRTTRTKTERRHYYRRTIAFGRRSTARTIAFFCYATDNRSDDDRAESRAEQKIAIFHKYNLEYNLGGEKLFVLFAATIYYAVNS